MAISTASNEAESIRVVFRAIGRYRRRGVLVFCTVLAVTILGIALSERVYRSQALLFFRLGRESVALDPTATTGQFVSLNYTREREILSAVGILKNHDVISKVVDRLGPDFILEPPAQATVASDAEAKRGDSGLKQAWQSFYGLMTDLRLADPTDRREKAIITLNQELSAEAIELTTIVEVSYDGFTPDHAQTVLEAVLEEYQREHLRAHRSSGSYDFFQEQTKSVEEELTAASEQLRDLKNNYEMLSIQGRREQLQQQMTNLDLQIFEVEADLTFSDEMLASLQGSLHDLPERLVIQQDQGLPNNAADAMREQLYELQIRQQSLLASRTPDHPEVRAVQEQVRQVSAILDQQQPERVTKTMGINPVRQPLEETSHREASRRGALGAKLNHLRQQRSRLLKDINDLNAREIEISQLERRVSLLDASYHSYAEKLEQSRMDQVLETEEISNVSVIQPPNLMHKPVRPRKLIALLLGFMGASLCWASVIYLSHLFDDTIRRPHELESSLGLKVLATFPSGTASHGSLSKAIQT